jgi:DMSO/TMAO reductase YedYZ molybdopterin-dependent catalytic subunit
LSNQAFILPVEGKVRNPLTFTYQQLIRMSWKDITVCLECAGNKRAHYKPKVFGEQWEEGAISQAVWKGVPLRELLRLCGIESSAKEVVFEGYDYGPRTDMEGVFSYARSLPLEKALHSDTIIAYEFNGNPIPYQQGHPLRLIVPHWYAMASVKWLRKITVIDHKFKGPFQTVDYVYYPRKDNDIEKKPVTAIQVNSIIQQPLDWSALDSGTYHIIGIAWTGTGAVTNVEISVDGGTSWDQAVIQSNVDRPYGWTNWSYVWNVQHKGEYTLLCRASDSFGHVQPLNAAWNRKGYGYNAVSRVHLKIE